MAKPAFSILSLVFALCFGIFNFLSKESASLQIHFLDVGQGDSILIVTPDRKKILIDGGPGNEVLQKLSAVIPYFYGKIDMMILTHPHEDHVEGLIPILERFRVDSLLLNPVIYNSKVYDYFLEKVAGKKVYIADDEKDFQFGEVYLDVLYPFESSAETFENVNNASVVIMIEWKDNKILLTGDAEFEVENELLISGIDLDADILKAGHHGSRTSSSLEFLEQVSPELMVISCGENNDYGHPHEETLEKAEEMNIEIRRTDLEGTISIVF